MLEYLMELGGWTWFIVAAVLIILEAAIPGVFLVWFGFAAAVAGVAAVVLGLAFPWQLLAFAVAAVATVVAARRFNVFDEARGSGSTLNARAKQYFGKTFILTEDIKNGRGKVKVGDTIWSVEGPDLPVGSSVVVTGASGNALVVKASRDAGDVANLPKAGNFG